MSAGNPYPHSSCCRKVPYLEKLYNIVVTECQTLAGSIDNAATNSVQVVVADASACSTACSANADCKLWVFFSDTYPVPAQVNICFLKWNLGFSYPVCIFIKRKDA
jgi:hypothetical protein